MRPPPRFAAPCVVVGMLCAGMFATIVVAATGSAQVEVVEVKRVLMAPRIWAVGTLTSRHEVRLAAEVVGKLVFVKELGARVKEGGVVARIDPTFIRLKIAELQTQLEEDRARLALLRDDVQHHKFLLTQNSTSQARLDELRADREVARNELRVSRARLKQAREDLRRQAIRSPFTGVVAERFLTRGEQAAVGDDVVRIIDGRALEVQVPVPSAAADFVQEGMPLTLSIDGREISALVSASVTTGDGVSAQHDLRIQLGNAVWAVGHTVRVALPTATAEILLAVPRAALLNQGAGDYVWRMGADNRAQRVAVKPGVTSGEWVAVSLVKNGGLSAGDRVVIRGADGLRPGSVVDILPDPGTARSNGK